MVSDQFVSRDFFRHLLQIGSLRFKLVGAVASNQAVERKGGEYLLVFNGETLGHLKVVREQEEEDASSGQLHDFTGTILPTPPPPLCSILSPGYV